MLHVVHSIAAAIDLLLPPTCLLCAKPLSGGQNRTVFCPHCISDIQPLTSGCCRQCAQPFHASGSDHLCELCLKNPPSFSAVYAVGKYQGSIKNAVQQLKYRNQLVVATPLGTLITESMDERSDNFNPDCVIPVPLHIKRLRARGYNQALELARPLAKKLAAPLCTTVLQRIRNTPHQQGLSATERRRNLRNAFALRSPLTAERILLVDDVMTTGETIRECCRVLTKNGAKEIRVAIAARA